MRMDLFASASIPGRRRGLLCPPAAARAGGLRMPRSAGSRRARESHRVCPVGGSPNGGGATRPQRLGVEEQMGPAPCGAISAVTTTSARTQSVANATGRSTTATAAPPGKRATQPPGSQRVDPVTADASAFLGSASARSHWSRTKEPGERPARARRPSACRTITDSPSGATTMSGRVAVAASATPPAIGTRAAQRSGVTCATSQSRPRVRSPSASGPKAGTSPRDPGHAATMRDRASMPSTPQPMTIQNGSSSPNGAATAPASAIGMTTTETSGSVSALPIRPKLVKR